MPDARCLPPSFLSDSAICDFLAAQLSRVYEKRRITEINRRNVVGCWPMQVLLLVSWVYTVSGVSRGDLRCYSCCSCPGLDVPYIRICTYDELFSRLNVGWHRRQSGMWASCNTAWWLPRTGDDGAVVTPHGKWNQASSRIALVAALCACCPQSNERSNSRRNVY